MDSAEQAARVEAAWALIHAIDEAKAENAKSLAPCEAPELPAILDALLTREQAARDEGRQEAQEITYQTMKAQMDAKVEAARREERERCAKIADTIQTEEMKWMGRHFNTHGEPLAAASAHAAKKIAHLIRRDPAGDAGQEGEG